MSTTDSLGTLLDSSILAGLHTCAPGASAQVQLRAHLRTKVAEEIFDSYSSLFFPYAFFHFKQFKNHKEVSEEPTVTLDSVFTTLLKRAYERGSNTLLEDGVQTKLRELASWLPPEQLLLGVKHVLLYLKSTVENFSSVRAIL